MKSVRPRTSLPRERSSSMNAPGFARTAGSANNRPWRSPRRAPMNISPRTTPCMASQLILCFIAPSLGSGTAKRMHPPPGPRPPLGVEAEAAVHDDFGADAPREFVWVEIDELGPFGEHEHGIGAFTRLDHRGRII